MRGLAGTWAGEFPGLEDGKAPELSPEDLLAIDLPGSAAEFVLLPMLALWSSTT